MTARQKTFNYSSAFINPNGVMNTTVVGTLVGNSSGRVITQGITASINRAFYIRPVRASGYICLMTSGANAKGRLSPWGLTCALGWPRGAS